MLIDRFGNEVINEPEIIEEPIVETYDPNRPVRSGFEKSQPVQEGLFNMFKPKPSETQKSSLSPKTIEDVENYHGIMIDKDFKKFITENPDGGKFKYPNAKIVSKEIIEYIDGEGDPSICSLNQFIDANCEYDGCIETCDYCLYIGGWIDDKALYLATNKSSCAPEGSIIFSDVIESGYDYNDRIFAKSFKDLLKNATFGKDIKEYSEMGIDEIDGHVDMFMEEKLSSDDRKELDDKCFGLVYIDENGNKIRKYPLTDKNGKWDEKHIRQAVRFFGHCPKEHQHQLALNILHAAHKIGLDTSKWDTVNKAAEEKDNDD